MGIRARRRRCERGRDGGTTYAPLWRIWRVLRPSWRGLWRGDEVEAAGMLLLAAMRVVELNLQTEVVRQLERTLATRRLVRHPLTAAPEGMKLFVVIIQNMCGETLKRRR